MGCLYKDSLINLYGDEAIVSYINGNTSDEIFEDLYVNLLKDNDRSKTNPLYAFENFYIKYHASIKDNVINKKLDEVIQSLYSSISMSNISNVGALATASSFFKSTFTRQDYLKKFATEEQQKDILKTKQALAYYATQIANKYIVYFDKKMELIKNEIDYKNNLDLKNTELSENAKKLLINFFIIQKSDSPIIQEIQEKYFVDLLSDPYGKTDNIYEQEFLVFYAINNFYKTSLTDRPELSFTNDIDEINVGGAAIGSDFININISSNLNGTNLDLVQTACHEVEHIIQSRKVKKDIKYNDLGYYYLIYELNSKYPQNGNNFNQEYEINYEYMEVEIDAEKVANRKLKIYIEDSLFKKYSLPTDKLNHRINKMNENLENRRPIFISRKILDGKSVPIYHYNISRLKSIVSQHSELVEEYPILESIFKKDGSLKPIEELLKNKPVENKIITDYILEEIYLNKLNDFDLTNFTSSEKTNFINNIANTFENELKKVKSIIENPDNISKQNGSDSYIDDINMIYRIVKILNLNMNVIEDNNLSPNVFYQLKSIINQIDANKKNVELFFRKPNVHPAYMASFEHLNNSLVELNKKYELARYNKMIIMRKEYIDNNNLHEVNENIIQTILSNSNFEEDFLGFIIKDNLQDDISVKDFINDFVKNNMINGKITNFNGDEISINDILNYFYQSYSESKNKANDIDLLSVGNTGRHI